MIGIYLHGGQPGYMIANYRAFSLTDTKREDMLFCPWGLRFCFIIFINIFSSPQKVEHALLLTVNTLSVLTYCHCSLGSHA